MIKKLLIFTTVLSLTLGLAAHRASADNVSDSAARASSYLLSQRSGDGSLQNTATSGWALMGLKANGLDSSQTIAYLENNLGGIESAPTTDVERTILAVLAGNRDPRNFGGKDLIAILKTKTEGNQIGLTGLLNDDIFGILALLASGEPISDPLIQGSLQHLISNQQSNGSFSWGVSSLGDSNDTAVAIQAIEYAQRKGYTGSYDESAAISYLQSTQKEDGGFAYQAEYESDASSTSWVINALITLNIDPTNWTKGSNTPFTYLQSLQLDNGGVKTSSTGVIDTRTTAYAAIALARRALPVAAIQTVPSPSPTPIPSPEPTPTPSPIASPTPVASPEVSPSPASSPIPSPTHNSTPVPTPSVVVSPSPIATPIATPSTSSTPTPSPSLSISPTPIASPSITPSPLPAKSPDSSPTPSPIPSPPPSPVPSPAPSPEPSPTPSPTPTPMSSPTPNQTATNFDTTTANLNQSTPRNRLSSPSLTINQQPLAPWSVSNNTDPDIAASPEATPTPSPSISIAPTTSLTTDSYEAFVRGQETQRPVTPTVVAAILMILLGLGTVTWGAVNMIKRKMSHNSKARF